MIVAVDNLIPYWEEAFAPLGELRPFTGRKLAPALLREAEVLIVRTVTRVDASLLEGSRVRFVGTASIGTDHLDLAYLKSARIHVANAAGCNANAVSEYVVAALLLAAERHGWDLQEKSIAIVGVGHVGSRVEKKARALGMEVVLCDPPLRDSTGDPGYLSFETAIRADVLTFHVPLTDAGPYPTYHMADSGVFDRLAPGRFVINTARGAVIDGAALKAVLAAGQLEGAVLDVWEGEPAIDYSLLELADIATPHIAGFSLDGKVRATQMMSEELCRFFDAAGRWEAPGIFPEQRTIRPAAGTNGMDAVRSAVRQAYDIAKDDSALRSRNVDKAPENGAHFEQLRNSYSFRPEFRHFSVELAPEHSELAPLMGALGFHVPCTSLLGGS